VWLDSLENNIGGYLEDNIGDEENGQGGVVLIGHELQILRQVKDYSIGNIRSVEEGQKVHDTQHWDDAPIDAGDESALRDAHGWGGMLATVGSGWMRKVGVVCSRDILIAGSLACALD